MRPRALVQFANSLFFAKPRLRTGYDDVETLFIGFPDTRLGCAISGGSVVTDRAMTTRLPDVSEFPAMPTISEFATNR